LGGLDFGMAKNRLVHALLGIDAHHTALGEFISKFAEVEATMQEVLWTLAGVTPATARALFSGTRSEAAGKLIRRIGEANKWMQTRMEAWKIITDQLSDLQMFRNHIVHYGANWTGPHAWIASNRNVAHTAESTISFPVSVSILNDATADLDKIIHHLLAFAGSPIPLDAREAFSESLKRAWRYKLPPQGGRLQKPRNTSPKRRRQRGSSQV
jgi:hypothetical protein